MKLIPRNWPDFQHYKDRSPPWIRLHKSLIDNYAFQMLPDASRALAPMLWLLASESDDLKSGAINFSLGEIAFRLRRTEKEIEQAIKPLIDKQFFTLVRDDSAVLAERKQSGLPETETETETETRKRATFQVPDWIPKSEWSAFMEVRKGLKAKNTDAAMTLLVKSLDRLRSQGQDVTEVINQSIEQSWKGLFPVKKNNGGRYGSHHERRESTIANLTGGNTAARVIQGSAKEVDRSPVQPDGAELRLIVRG